MRSLFQRAWPQPRLTFHGLQPANHAGLKQAGFVGVEEAPRPIRQGNGWTKGKTSCYQGGFDGNGFRFGMRGVEEVIDVVRGQPTPDWFGGLAGANCAPRISLPHENEI